MTIVRLISGGQTGADRGAWDAAISLKIPTGGVVPAGRRAEDGRVPDAYPVDAERGTYEERTAENVAAADLVLVLVQHRGQVSGGTALTVRTARRMGRTKEVVVLGDPVSLRRLERHLRAVHLPDKHLVVCVAGPRESKAPGIQRSVGETLGAALRRVLAEKPVGWPR